MSNFNVLGLHEYVQESKAKVKTIINKSRKVVSDKVRMEKFRNY